MFLNFTVLVVSMIILTIIISAFNEMIFTPHYETNGEKLYFLENPENRSPRDFSINEEQQLLKVDAPVNWCLLSSSVFSFHPSKKGVLKDFEGHYANENYLKILDLDFIRGERYSQKQIENGQRVILISETVAEFIFESTDVIGREVVVFNMPYKVVGVFKNMSRIAGTTAVAFLPAEFNTWDRMNWNIAVTNDELDKDILEKTFNKHASEIFGNVDGRIKLLSRGNLVLNEMGRLQMGIFVILLAMALPALLMVNLIITRMETKLNEMGIRKAFGADRKAIFWHLIYENIIFTLIGGIAALLIGQFVVSNLLYEEEKFTLVSMMNIPVSTHLVVMLGYIIFGFISGWYPSRLIAKKSIVTSINNI
ncbi:MAG TPA: ABC transporter permease [Bacteroidales bacterium]|nr:ABC transporter permease [Bacteroidales bacterium]